MGAGNLRDGFSFPTNALFIIGTFASREHPMMTENSVFKKGLPLRLGVVVALVVAAVTPIVRELVACASDTIFLGRNIWSLWTNY
jgi:hypothetical protein